MSDPIEDAFKSLHQGNLLAAKDARIRQLEAEVEAQAKRWAESEDLILHYKQQRDEAYNNCECHRLKAEVDNTNRINRELLILSNRQASDIRRLTKVGDELAENFKVQTCPWTSRFNCYLAWNRAKEGKPSV
jgi:hypothetical protein